MQTLAAFTVAAVLFTVVPGPSVAYLVTRALSQGRAAGFASAAGISTGSLVQVAATAAGLSAVLASSVVAFSVVKYLGAAYLIYLGIRTLLARSEPRGDRQLPQRSLWRVYGQSVLVTVLNPKLALFLLALLPQFIHPSSGPAAGQITVLGILLVIIVAINDNCYALLAGTLGARLRRSTRAERTGRLASGCSYIGLGIVAAVTGHRPGST